MYIKELVFVCLVMGWCLSMTSCGFTGSSVDRKNDSLFLGISLGMDKKVFYDHCWELNRKKVVLHGPTNTSVQYTLKNELKQPVMMNFYPSFYKDKIFEMPVTFSYEAWAPWNKQYSSDTLLVNMLTVFEKWYGKGFKIHQHPTQGVIYFKKDGRRRINLFIRDDQFVQAIFTDMKVEKEIKDLKKNTPVD